MRDALKSNTCLVKCIKINPARLLCPTHTISARTSRPASRPSADFGASVDGAGQVSERPSARIMGRARPQTYQFSIHSAAARVVAVRRVESTNGRIGAVGRLWHTRLWRAKAVRIASIDVHARKSYRGSRQNSCACAPARSVHQRFTLHDCEAHSLMLRIRMHCTMRRDRGEWRERAETHQM